MEKKKKANFSSSMGFVLSAAASAVGVGNIWRFPYLAARGGGGLFILIYIILLFTFGFTMLTTDIAIGRKTGKNALGAYKSFGPKWGFLGKLTFIVPAIIMTYYSVIGGWILKYATIYMTGAGTAAAQDGYFTSFITSPVSPIVFMLVFLAATSFLVYCGVEKGIEKSSIVIMPLLILTIAIIAIFSLTLSYTDETGVTRTGMQGLAVYLIPNFEGITFSRFLQILLEAMTQLFYSLSIAMGIMITYGSYVKKETDLNKSISHIEICDTLVALLAGLMIIPAVYVFFGMDGMSSGPSLVFISLPKIFEAMGGIGTFIGLAFFIMFAFAALTSNVSIMEAIVANCMEMFHSSRKKTSLVLTGVYAIGALIVCLGYNIFYFELKLPNGAVGQILDVADYVSNNVLMPIVALLTSVLIGWVVKPKWVIDEVERNGEKFGRRNLYAFIIKYIAPFVMFILLLQALGIL